MHAMPYVISLYLFLGTNAGALAAFLLYKIPKIKTSHLYFLCGAVLTVLLAFELIPHALEEYSFISVAFGASLGVLSCMCLHGLFKGVSSSTYRPALFITLAIAIHNIPAGLAVGSTLDNDQFAVSFIAATVIHQIPEGLAIMTSLLLSGKRYTPVILFFIFSVFLSVIFFLFSSLGHSLELPSKSNGLILGTAIGFLLFTALVEFLFRKNN
ncbi:ZIP family metal transporter [Domibacillus robiginosus]|uniref:ZIP family metal transporter n=1 Tax=Domibacillus robiginosus TaxID=1071054 RepID=UPI00067C6A22|nr:ZIP family metal transporter [Domibacillus robiginosus]